MKLLHDVTKVKKQCLFYIILYTNIVFWYRKCFCFQNLHLYFSNFLTAFVPYYYILLITNIFWCWRRENKILNKERETLEKEKKKSKESVLYIKSRKCNLYALFFLEIVLTYHKLIFLTTILLPYNNHV